MQADIREIPGRLRALAGDDPDALVCVVAADLMDMIVDLEAALAGAFVETRDKHAPAVDSLVIPMEKTDAE